LKSADTFRNILVSIYQFLNRAKDGLCLPLRLA
jgi:hypothetical protein